MNMYDIDGDIILGHDACEAVKKAYRLDTQIELVGYLEDGTRKYRAEFPHGEAIVLVKRVREL